MNREQLEHVIRAAADITGIRDLVVIGSQAVLGTYPKHALPYEATISNEADVAVDVVLAHLDDVDESLVADQIEGALGPGSRFDLANGYHAEGVEVATAALTPGWRDRLVPLIAESASGPAVGWCLEVNDLWVSKAAAGRHKDFSFCVALAREGLVDKDTCAARLATLRSDRRARAEAVFARAFPTNPSPNFER